MKGQTQVINNMASAADRRSTTAAVPQQQVHDVDQARQDGRVWMARQNMRGWW
ncbi:uncharacterized protein MYCFIDRAFT_182416 [Pseudocercospora fijiensis CIRAD86]|uniref:Uncharacterized protein n=1 Tax=Pseudocercospora fijiensis (strain CIRAD86) TaxID=383855 RepID=M3A0L0_PSEFD|nr:uncharacterized protein MYCFIDRAFT_182416 [Pseudocercospora fijiensis CIRAD86]EME84689.1 hypothetical protein MYCFIDRAFT_182416 [Pseudocercospora fijiensis CIRAD86]